MFLVLGPINSEARLKMNPDPQSNAVPFSIPKILLNLTMEKLAVALTKHQYQDMMQVVEQFGRMARAYPYRRYRPYGISYRNHYREWWHFAFTCIIETDIRRRKKEWSWEHMLENRRLRHLYAEVYKQKLTNKKPSPEILEKCNECERKLNIQQLVVIRQKIELEIDKINKEKAVEQQKGGWFSGWWGGKKDDANIEDSDDLSKKNITLAITSNQINKFLFCIIEANIKAAAAQAMTPEEKEKLFKAIGYQENASPTELPENYVATQLQFKLSCLEISVKSNISGEKATENVILLRLNQVQCAVHQRPSAQSIKLDLTMRELLVYGLKQKEFEPVLIQKQIESSDSLLKVVFESNPIEKTCDQRVNVQSQPIQIVYDGETVIQLLKVFQTPKTTTLSQYVTFYLF